jgi:transketolase
MEAHAARWRGFGWHVIVIDGHDVQAILDALEQARATTGRPTVIVARTIKGQGISLMAGKPGWHGRALKTGEEVETALRELESQFVPEDEPAPKPQARKRVSRPVPQRATLGVLPYKPGETVATREAYGAALARLGGDTRIVVLDADVGNSTFSDKFQKQFPDRFYQNFISEQVMIGSSMGLAARGAIPFPSTFAAFLSRAYDFIRMGAISRSNFKLAGSHAGVSIGEDGPSQMALEDLAMMRAQPDFAVLYPCDAVSTERLIEQMAYREGPAYMRTSRPKTPVIYGNDEPFEIGGLKVLRESDSDVATVIGAGVTVFQALEAHDTLKLRGSNIRVVDLYSLQPIDAATLIACAKATGGRLITVEDHYHAGGIGDAVAEAVASAGFTVEQRLCVREIPRSGTPEELIDHYGLSARHIVDAVTAR